MSAVAAASLVIASYEEANELSHTIDSVLAAAVVPQEIVVVDCAVQGGWLEPLLDVLEHNPDALVGPAMRDARDPRSSESEASSSTRCSPIAGSP